MRTLTTIILSLPNNYTIYCNRAKSDIIVIETWFLQVQACGEGGARLKCDVGAHAQLGDDDDAGAHSQSAHFEGKDSISAKRKKQPKMIKILSNSEDDELCASLQDLIIESPPKNETHTF